MLYEVHPPNRHVLRPLFASYTHQRVFIDGTLDGQFGYGWTDDPEQPHVALLLDALAYVGGDVTAPTAKELLHNVDKVSESVFVPSAAWGQLLVDIHGDQFVPVEWVSLTSRSVDLDHIRLIKQDLPVGFRVQRIDDALAVRLFQAGILVFRTYGRSPERFVREGIGFCVLDGDNVASVINSMAIYNGQLKGSIQTLMPYRGQGLATIAAAHLVEHCLAHHIEYCWEATNEASQAVARKVGFSEDGRMLVYQHKDWLNA